MQRFRRYLNPIRAIRRHVWPVLTSEARARAAFPLARRLFYRRDGESPAYPTGVLVRGWPTSTMPPLSILSASIAPGYCLRKWHQPAAQSRCWIWQRNSHGIINLHTGPSPYTRGGNCNLYALRDGHPEWVGVTVHYIDPGIDSGELIRTAQVPMHA